jgi:hypothetical protein
MRGAIISLVFLVKDFDYSVSNPVELRGQRGVLYWYDRVWAVCLLLWSDDA